MKTNEISYLIIGAAMDVHSELGPGLLESVYQEALAIELTKREITFEREAHLAVYYKGIKLKKGFYADFCCYNSIILELKVCSSITNEHICQIMNYMRITKYSKGMILNFGNKSLEHRTYNLNK